MIDSFCLATKNDINSISLIAVRTQIIKILFDCVVLAFVFLHHEIDFSL